MEDISLDVRIMEDTMGKPTLSHTNSRRLSILAGGVLERCIEAA